MAAASQVQAGAAAGGALELRQHCPPAAVGRDVHTLLKFYNLSTSLLNVIFMVRVLFDVRCLPITANLMCTCGKGLP